MFDLVMKHMIHYCTKLCRVQKGRCKNGLPKPYQEKTKRAVSSYPLYRRRKPGELGCRQVVINKGKATEKIITNGFVVPYNARSLLRMNAHVCVEICASIRAVKYLYMYFLKGHD